MNNHTESSKRAFVTTAVLLGIITTASIASTVLLGMFRHDPLKRDKEGNTSYALSIAVSILSLLLFISVASMLTMLDFSS